MPFHFHFICEKSHFLISIIYNIDKENVGIPGVLTLSIPEAEDLIADDINGN